MTAETFKTRSLRQAERRDLNATRQATADQLRSGIGDAAGALVCLARLANAAAGPAEGHPTPAEMEVARRQLARCWEAMCLRAARLEGCLRAAALAEVTVGRGRRKAA